MRGYEPHAWAIAESGNADVAALIGIGGGERRGTPWVGIKALMLAILEDAIRAYLGPVGASRAEAAFWIANSRSHFVFSFPVVCETLGLEPAAVRAALRRMHAGGAAERPLGGGRSRPNARRRAGLGHAAGRVETLAGRGLMSPPLAPPASQ